MPRNGRELLRLTNDGARGRRSGRRSATRSRSSTSRARSSTSSMARLDGDAPELDGQGHHRPDRGLRPRRRVATGLVRPGRPAARRRPRRPCRRPPRAPPTRLAVGRSDRDLPRAARRADGGGRQRPVPRPRPRPGTRCRPASRRTSPASSAFATLVIEAAGPYAAAIKPNLAFFEALGSAGLAALERIRGRIPADIPVVIDAKRGDIGSTAARQAVALFDGSAPTPSPSTRTRAARRSRRSSSAPTASPTSCAGPRTPARPSSRTSSSRPIRRSTRPAEPLHLRVARRVATWGPGGTVGLVVGATAPAELPRSGPSRPGSASSCPGIGAQGGEIEPVLRDGPATAAPAGAGPGRGLLVNVSRGIAGAALGEPGARSAERPGRAARGGRPRLGFAPPCATLARARGPTPSHDPAHRIGSLIAGATTIMPTPGPLELVIILVIALLILGPGKLPDVGAVARQEHPRVPQGVVRRPGRGQGQRRHVAAARPTPRPPPRRPRPAPRPRPPRRPGTRRGRPGRRPTPTDPADPTRRPRARRPPPTRRSSPASRAPSTRPWPTPTPCASRVSPDVPRRPTRAAPAAGRRARRRDGHVARRPPRRAAHPAVPVDPRGRRRVDRRLLRVATRSSSSWPTPLPGDDPAPRHSASATRSSSRSRSRSSSGSSWRCRSCSTSSGRSSRRA